MTYRRLSRAERERIGITGQGADWYEEIETGEVMSRRQMRIRKRIEQGLTSERVSLEQYQQAREELGFYSPSLKERFAESRRKQLNRHRSVNRRIKNTREGRREVKRMKQFQKDWELWQYWRHKKGMRAAEERWKLLRRNFDYLRRVRKQNKYEWQSPKPA